MSQKNWNEVDLIFRGHHEPMSSAATRMAIALRERAVQNNTISEDEVRPVSSTATPHISRPQALLKNAFVAAKTLLSGLAADDEGQPVSQVAFSDEM
jgi:hypothetical protein